MKILKLTLFIFSLLFSSIIICDLQDVKVFEYNSTTANYGYGDYNIKSNGELAVMQKLVKSGDVLFDVGANKGDWSKSAFGVCKDVLVYAFEPIKSVFRELEGNFLNENFIPYNLAFSSYIGAGSFYYCCGKRGSYDNHRLSSFYNRECYAKILKEGTEKITVDVSTIDFFCESNGISRIDFLKIDTEGAELAVLQGAKGLLSENKISAIQFEYGGCYKDSKATLRQVYDLLTGFGYSIFRIAPNGLVRISRWNGKLENFKYSNYLAIN